MDTRQKAIEQLKGLLARRDGPDPARLPQPGCHDVTTHLMGIWVKTYHGLLLEALRRMD